MAESKSGIDRHFHSYELGVICSANHKGKTFNLAIIYCGLNCIWRAPILLALAPIKLELALIKLELAPIKLELAPIKLALAPIY